MGKCVVSVLFRSLYLTSPEGGFQKKSLFALSEVYTHPFPKEIKDIGKPNSVCRFFFAGVAVGNQNTLRKKTNKQDIPTKT